MADGEVEDPLWADGSVDNVRRHLEAAFPDLEIIAPVAQRNGAITYRSRQRGLGRMGGSRNHPGGRLWNRV